MVKGCKTFDPQHQDVAKFFETRAGRLKMSSLEADDPIFCIVRLGLADTGIPSVAVDPFVHPRVLCFLFGIFGDAFPFPLSTIGKAICFTGGVGCDLKRFNGQRRRRNDGKDIYGPG